MFVSLAYTGPSYSYWLVLCASLVTWCSVIRLLPLHYLKSPAVTLCHSPLKYTSKLAASLNGLSNLSH